MGGLRSRILRTFKSFPNVAAAQSQHANLLLPHAAASPPPSPGLVQQVLQQEQEEDTPTLELPSISACSESDSDTDAEKENSRPEETTPWKKRRSSEEVEIPSYRRPALASATLFDPDLLIAFRHAVAAHRRSLEEAKHGTDSDQDADEEPPAKVPRTGNDSADFSDPFAGFEDKCPPGGGNAAVLYTTTLRGVRKTFEDCNRVRLLLESLRVGFLERDISMDMGYREELWRVLGWRAIPPRLFIRGRYIGGAEEAVGLHEQGRLRPMLRHLPALQVDGETCGGCGGLRFVMCGQCSGSHRLYDDESAGHVPCPGCNENGLVPCPLCS